MSGKKVGSDGQVRKTTSEWAADTATYPEGMRLMDTDTGTVRVSKGTTYAQAWVQSSGGGASAWGDITGTLSDQTDLQSVLNTKLEVADLSPTATFSTNTNTAQDPGQDTVRFNSGTIASVTEIGLSDVVGGVDKGTLNSQFSGIIQFRPVGTTGTIEFQITGAVHTSWTRYTVTYLKGTIPANGTVMAVRFIPVNVVTQTITNGETATSPSEDAVFDALAGKADKVNTYVAALSQVTTGNITATVIQNTYGGTPVYARTGVGTYTITLTGAWTAGTTVDITNSVVSAGTDLRGFINYRVASTDVIELTCEDVDRVVQDIENTNFSIHIQS